MKSMEFPPSAFRFLLTAGISRAERLAGLNMRTLPGSSSRSVSSRHLNAALKYESCLVPEFCPI